MVARDTASSLQRLDKSEQAAFLACFDGPHRSGLVGYTMSDLGLVAAPGGAAWRC